MITILRIALIPVFVFFYFSNIEHNNWYAAGVLVLAGVSDGIDGYLARKWNQETKLGSFLDPVADKLLVVSTLIAISFILGSIVVASCAIIITAREVYISALREFVAIETSGDTIKVSQTGKIKTFLQMVSITGLVWAPNEPLFTLAHWLLYAATILTVYSMYEYTMRTLEKIKNNDAIQTI